MREAVIVSTARTPLTKAHRGEFNITPGATLASFAVKAAVERSGLDPALIEDAILGCGYPEGTTGRNIARQSIIRSGLPKVLADIREFAKEDPLFWQPSPLLVELVERGADFSSLNQSE